MLHWAAYLANEELVIELLLRLVHPHNCHAYKTTTPLHIASQRGHLSICWILLLSDEFSLDVVDEYGNTPLHTAAANGHASLVKCLLDHGADWTKRNKYRFTALEVASNETCRDILKQVAYHPTLTREERLEMKRTQKESYQELESSMKNLMAKDAQENELQSMIQKCEKFGMRKEIIDQARQCVHWLRVRSKTLKCMQAVKEITPVVNATSFQVVNELKFYIQKVQQNVIEMPVEVSDVIAEAVELCKRSKTEFDLHSACRRLDAIKCGSELDLQMMEILRGLMVAAGEHSGDEDLIGKANSILCRLTSELELQKANDAVPTVRLPEPGMTPKQAALYWQTEDVGCIEQTEVYPLPPPDDGYIWIKSASYQTLERAVNDLELKINKATECDGNTELIHACASLLKSRRADLKLLQSKDEEDRAAAIAIAEKAAKKLLQKKKKSKK